MVYRMYMRIDGGCRRNGSWDPIGAAAVYREYKNGNGRILTYCLEEYPKPISQRAELHAVILALETALKQANKFHSNPRFEVTIYLDSKYALGCMTDWIFKWRRNDFTASNGKEVVNRDLVERASDLQDELTQQGSITYIWVPRSENEIADAAVNGALDELEARKVGFYI